MSIHSGICVNYKRSCVCLNSKCLSNLLIVYSIVSSWLHASEDQCTGVCFICSFRIYVCVSVWGGGGGVVCFTNVRNALSNDKRLNCVGFLHSPMNSLITSEASCAQ